MTKAYSYLRFSTPEQMRGDSFRRQTAAADEYAARHGLDLDAALTFRDLGVSAYRGKNAEDGSLGAFLEAVKAGIVAPGSWLLVESLDRISRQTARKALRVLESIVDAGITVVTLADGRAYSEEALDSDPMALMLALLTFVRANEESATKARRLREAWKGKRARAADRPLTSICPAWLRLDSATGAFVVIPERAAVVARIFAMAAEGVGLHGIADTLNREGVDTFGEGKRKGDFWRRSYVLKIITSAAPVGTLVPHAMTYTGDRKARTALEPIDGYFPAVVDREVWAGVQAMRQGGTKAPIVRGAGEVTNLLAGLARCPDCGRTMTRVVKGSSSRAGKPRLVCTGARAAGCKAPSVILAAVEAVILERAGEMVADAPSGSATLDAQIGALESAMAAQRDRVEDLANQYAETRSPVIAARLKEAEEGLGQMQAEDASLRQRAADASGPLVARRLVDLQRHLEAVPLDRTKANAALRAAVASVIVDGRDGALAISWKHGGETTLRWAWPEGDC